MLSVGQLLPDDIEQVEILEGDYYGEDGLLRCGTCGGKKQFRIPQGLLSPDGERVVRCVCKCHQEKEAEAKEEEKRGIFKPEQNQERKPYGGKIENGKILQLRRDG